MEDARSDEEKATALLNAAKKLIDISKAMGMSRSVARDMMVHPDNDADDPGLIFDMLWPEGN